MQPNKMSDKELSEWLDIINDPVRWIETFLINPRNKEHIRLNRAQRRILDGYTRRNVIRVHRRAGKTYVLCMFALWYAMNHDSGIVLIICPDLSKVKKFFKEIDELIRVNNIFDGCVERANNSNNPIMRTFANNGSEILGFTAGSRSKSNADSVRSATADVVIVDEAAFLNDEDWDAIDPIMDGDATRPNVISFVSSTPRYLRNHFWELCTSYQENLDESERWRRVHIPITENRDFSPGRVAAFRARCRSESKWMAEYMAEFPDVGEGVYRRSHVERAACDYEYIDLSTGYVPPPAIRTIGVDWDKYAGTGPCVLCLELDEDTGDYRAVYFEEVEPGKYCLTSAVNRIIALNRILNPAWIYVDRGFGEGQIEMLHLHGEEYPESGLINKVVGISFSQRIEVIDPVTGEKFKVPIKPAMVELTNRWLEDDRFRYPRTHTDFEDQMLGFHLHSKSDVNVRFADDNDHILAAWMLAAYAMDLNYGNRPKLEPATRCHVLEVPNVVKVSVEGTRVGIQYIPDDENLVVRKNLAARKLPRLANMGLSSSGYTRSNI